MEIGYLNEVKAILKSLVISYPDKITIDKLNRDYRDVEGEDIPFRRLGHRSLEQFLRQIPDTLLISGSGHSALIYFVNNGKSDHIHDMIMSQKKSKTKNKATAKNGCMAGGGGRNNNRFIPSKQPASRMLGQQFSPFGITNRHVTTKKVTVRDIPQTRYNTKNPSYNHKALFDALPQSKDTKSNQSTFQRTNKMKNCQGTEMNAGKHPANEKVQEEKNLALDTSVKYQEHLKQLENLMATSCHVTSSPTKKTVSFTAATKNGKPCASSNADISLPRPDVKQAANSERSLIKVHSNVKKNNPLKVEAQEIVVAAKPVDPKGIERVETVNNFKKLLNISDAEVNDMDEAVPEFAANHQVFRLDFPKYTMSYGHKIPPYKIPDNIHVDSRVGVFIAEIHNPFKFWFHFHKEDHELDALMNQMERYYTSLDSNRLSIPLLCLIPGQICAACYNGMWHRAEIAAPPINNSVKVSFLDYGTVSEVDISDVKYLALYFSQLPAQALRGCLSHIKPRGLHWSHEATTYFLSSVAELLLYAKITEIDRENLVFYMILCDTNGEKVVQINKNLVDKNYALFNEDWQDFKIKKNKDRRVHHPREDFPTFSMIESGEYPSFRELIHLQQHGIDYEIIYDRILFNKCAILNTQDNVPETIRNLPFFLMTTNPFRTDIVLELTGIKTSTC